MVEAGAYKDRFAQAMRQAGFNPGVRADQVRLSKALKITPQAVAKILAGTTKMMAADNNVKAAQVLGVSSEWLACGDGLPYSALKPSAPVAEVVAAERQPAWMGAWPFNTITREQVDALSPAGLALLEQHMQVAFGVIGLTPANFKPDASSRKALAAA